MTTRDLYHGTNGDSILQILGDRQMRPNSEGKIFFSEYRYDSVLMHGADIKRKVTLAVKVRVQIPLGAELQRALTPGVADTLVVTTIAPIPAEIIELYIRRPQATAVEVVRGAADIRKELKT